VWMAHVVQRRRHGPCDAAARCNIIGCRCEDRNRRVWCGKWGYLGPSNRALCKI
jgi:hypothetical protein